MLKLSSDVNECEPLPPTSTLAAGRGTESGTTPDTLSTTSDSVVAAPRTVSSAPQGRNRCQRTTKMENFRKRKWSFSAREA